METTIIVAIIGAVTALFGVLITAALGFLTWSRNIQHRILTEERNRLEDKFEKALDLLHEGLREGMIHARLYAMCAIEFPENVQKQFQKLLESSVFESNEDFEKKKAMFEMSKEMSLAIKEYDENIRKNATVVDKEFAARMASEILRRQLFSW